jgi:hypothetical protein
MPSGKARVPRKCVPDPIRGQGLPLLRADAKGAKGKKL